MVGALYFILFNGDYITLKRAKAILERLEEKGFASGNVIFGIGSYTYQFATRDNFGFALTLELKNLQKAYFALNMKRALWFSSINNLKKMRPKGL